MDALLSVAARRLIVVPLVVTAILCVATAQHIFVLKVSLSPERLILPTLVGLVVGWVLSAVARMTLAARRQSRELAISKEQIELLNSRLEQALAHQIEARTVVEQELIRAQRMESVGHMTVGIAHDLNNVLTVILGSAEILQWGSPHNIPKRAELLASAAERGAGLLRRLMSFMRGQADLAGRVDFGRLLLDIRPLLDQLVGSDVVLEIEVGPDDYTVPGSAVGLEQVVLNLVANARDAMVGREGSIRIAVHREGNEVMLTVSDDGVGMDEDVLEKAAQPLFTTKPEGKGTGLGLAVVERQAGSLGGRIRIDSKLGTGTTVLVIVPHAARGAVPAEAAAIAPARVGGCERILVVEGDPAVQVILAGILEHAGYEVHRAVDICAAQEEIKRQLPDLVISDSVLPDGCDWSDSKGAFPAANVLLVSGYADPLWPSEGLPVVHKPYSATEILRAVRKTLDAAASAEHD